MSQLHTPRALVPFRERRTYAETADLLSDLVIGCVYFSVFISLLATGASLLITLIGLPILTGAMYLARAAAAFERHRIRVFLGERIATPPHAPATGVGILQTPLEPVRDAATRRELFYVAVVQPMIGIVNFTVIAVVWLVPLWLIAMPFYAASSSAELWNGKQLTWSAAAPAAVTGLLLLLLTPRVVRALAAADRGVARRFLAPKRSVNDQIEVRADLVMQEVRS